MSLVNLGTNIAALSAQRRLGQSTEGVSRVFERLSSGQRINRASDDAAGLSIALNLNKDTRVYSQAIRNGNDALSALSITQGSVDQLSTVLIRLKELATQAANGTLSLDQRLTIDGEGEALTNEFNRLVASSTFNGLSLTDGSLGLVGIQLGYGSNGQIGVGFGQGLTRNVSNGYTGSASYTSGGSAIGAQQTAGDFNGDGKADIVTVNATTGNIAIALGNGDGTFVAPVTYSAVASATSITSGDLNGDGNLDLVVGSASGGSILLGNGNGSFQSAASFSSTDALQSTITAADLNGDGLLDIVGVGSSASGVKVFLNQGGGQFSSATTLATTGSVSDVAVGDFNADGRVDILSSTGSGQLDIFNGNGNGTFSAKDSSLFGSNVGRLVIGDFNYDGRPDIASTYALSGVVTIRLANGNNTFGAAQTISVGIGYGGISVLDATGDGVVDIVAVKSNKLQILKGNGDGTFDSSNSYAVSVTNGNSLTSGDFNGDGVLDYSVGSGAAGSAYLYLSNATAVTTLQRLNLTTRQEALAALSTIDAAFNRVTKELGNIGSSQSRILAALSTLGASRENSQAAASRITDVDVASETAELVRFGILQQAGSAILSHAVDAPNLVLTLLGR